MTFKKILKINGNNKITLDLPEEFSKVDEIIITINDKKDKDKLLKEIELSMKDPKFIDDIKEINNDFKFVDTEIK